VTNRDPIVGIPTKYHRHVCASVLPERLAQGWVREPWRDYELNNPDAVGGVAMLYAIGWPIEMRAGELPPGLDEEYEGLLSAVAAFEGEK
jgi:hypothetical protein